MKKYFLLLLFIPAIGIGQTKDVVNFNRVFPKNDKVVEFERALANHAQKYHTGDWQWRVFSIETGPDAGGYQIAEGPSSWEAIDGRGDLGAEHLADWDKNVVPFLIDRGTSSFAEYNAELSTVALTDYADKVSIGHIYPKPGKMTQLKDLVKGLKKVWQAGKESVVVFETVSSGEPSLTIAFRMKDGLKEMSANYRKPFPERYNAIHGAGAFDKYLQKFAEVVEKRWEELIFYNASLSSK